MFLEVVKENEKSLVEDIAFIATKSTFLILNEPSLLVVSKAA